jgi:protein kinase-like protein
MTPSPESSPSSTEAEPGTTIGGFRVERLVGRGPRGTVYEALQAGLERRVALKLLPATRDLPERLAWPDHPNVVSLYAAGRYEGGSFVAMQLVRGNSLAVLRSRSASAHTQIECLRAVAGAIDAAHTQGIVHGSIKAENVLVAEDGRSYLSDFGLASEDATIERDLAEFAELVESCTGASLVGPAPPSARGAVDAAAGQLAPPAQANRRRRAWIGGGVALVAAAAVAVLLLGAGSAGVEPPPVLAGSVPLGSDLTTEDVGSLDCLGQAPSGASPGCTLVQTRLPGVTVAAPRSGVIRRWTVRGARGQLSLQVVRGDGDRFASKARTDFVTVPDTGIHAFPAELPVRRGDLVGLGVSPGAAVGVRQVAPGAETARWIGPLTETARPIDLGPGSGFDHEVLLRVEFTPGAKLRLPGELTGAAARSAPAGTPLGSRQFELVDGAVRSVTIVRLPDRVALDLFRGSERLLRVTVSGADPRGRLDDLSGFRRPSLEVTWRNPDGQIISHEYGIRLSSVGLRQ